MAAFEDGSNRKSGETNRTIIMKKEYTATIPRFDKASFGGFAIGLLISNEQMPCSGTIQIPINEEIASLFSSVNSVNPVKLKITIES